MKIYWETIKKYAIKAGIPSGIAGVILLFIYLSLGAVDITGYSGDTVCAGTELDPCYAYINFTAKENIFIYPTDYDPWGRDTPFETDKELKSWKIYRSWGNSWREINLSKTWSSQVKYAIKFSKGQDYQIRIVAYKNNPYDDIKWGFGPVDPIWKSPYKNEYTSTTETHCKDGVCNLILYSGIRFVEEDDVWKKVEDARSLKNKGFNVVYLKNDSNYEIEIEDFNYTCLKKLKIKSQIEGNIPFKIWNETYVSPYMNSEEIELENICMDNIFAYNFTLGENSTTIQLQDANTENLEDTSNNEYPDDNETTYGDLQYLRMDSGQSGFQWRGRTYIMWNISVIDEAVTIEDSQQCFYSTDYNDAYPANVDGFEVYNSTWSEDTLNWVNQPCGVEFDDDTNCDLTAFDDQSVTATDQWFCFNSTDILEKNKANDTISFAFFCDPENPGTRQRVFPYSKEHATTSLRPYLNITYSEAGDPDINYSVALPLNLIRFLNCSPDWEDANARPDGQTATIAAINATNNGTAVGSFSINLTGVLNTGWTIWASNDSLVNNLTLSTSAQTIWSDVEINETKKIWLAANCSYVSANPGQSITMWAI